MKMRTKTSLRVEVRERGSVEVGSVPIVEGMCSLCSALSACCCDKVDAITFLCSDEHKASILELRATVDPNRRRELKKQLPAITPAGVFSPKRGNGYIESYSSMLGIDIDGKDNPSVEDWSAAAHRIGERSQCVIYAGLSAGGRGCFVLYSIAEPQRYAEHFAAIVTELDALGFNADRQCGDVSRLRFASYDPAPYINKKAAAHRLPIISVNNAIISPQRLALARAPASMICAPQRPINADVLYQRIERAVKALMEQRSNIAEYYNDWLRIGCALASTFGERGRWMYHAISSQSSKYKELECDNQYTRCLRSSRIGIGTLCYYLKQAGIRW